MEPLQRLIEPARHGRGPSNAPKIHYESPDGRKLMCGQAEVFHTVDNQELRIWYHTKREVTCKSCITAVRIMVRKELDGLSGGQLEDLRAHIDTFKNRYGAMQSSEAVSPRTNGTA